MRRRDQVARGTRRPCTGARPRIRGGCHDGAARSKAWTVAWRRLSDVAWSWFGHASQGSTSPHLVCACGLFSQCAGRYFGACLAASRFFSCLLLLDVFEEPWPASVFDSSRRALASRRASGTGCANTGRESARKVVNPRSGVLLRNAPVLCSTLHARLEPRLRAKRLSPDIAERLGKVLERAPPGNPKPLPTTYLVD